MARIALRNGNFLFRSAMVERISGVALRARAHWDVVDDVANGALAAGSNARVLALVSQTSLASVALVVDDTFWTAALVGVSKVLGNAFADGIVLGSSAVSIWSTG